MVGTARVGAEGAWDGLVGGWVEGWRTGGTHVYVYWNMVGGWDAWVKTKSVGYSKEYKRFQKCNLPTWTRLLASLLAQKVILISHSSLIVELHTLHCGGVVIPTWQRGATASSDHWLLTDLGGFD